MAKRLTIPAGEFKAKCLQLMDMVDSKRIEVEITKRGRPIAKLVPIEKSEKLFGCLEGSVTYHANVVDPIDVDWESNV
jgi:prevent-host-death family protein